MLAKFQNKLPGCRADVILRALGEPHGINAHYGAEEWRRFPMHRSPMWRRGRTSSFTLAVRFSDIVSRAAKGYDVIHVHTDMELVSFIRARHPDKKILLHHHGDNLRQMDPAHREKHERHADKVVVSTTDLCEYGGHEWLPNPVDTDLFAASGRPTRNGRAVYFIIRDEPRDIKMRLLMDSGISLDYTVHDTNASPVPYPCMPAFLSKYEYYIDVKWLPIGKVMEGVSMTGLQALALGLKLIDHNFDTVEGLPRWHRPEDVVARLVEHYTR